MKRSRTARAVRLLLWGGAAAAVLLGAAACGGGGGGTTSAPTTETEVPTTVFGRQATELAVGIAARRRGTNVRLTTTVLGPDATPRRGLRVAYATANGPWISASECGPGRYCGGVPVAVPRPLVRVRLARPSGRVSTVSVRLPEQPQPERAAAIVRATGAALRSLHSLIVNERLASGPPYEPLVTQFSYIAPNRMSYRITNGGEAVVIGGHRWDRERPTSRWTKSPWEPTRVPEPDWRRVRNPSILGAATRDGRAVDMVSFYDPSIPAWFEAEIDRATSLPLQLRMIAAAHFMTHTFGAFNAPLEILPPT
jgi:hypothetical protein